IARKALARAGEKRDHRLYLVRHPDRDAVSADEPLGAQVVGDTVRPGLHLPPDEAPGGVAQREGVRARGGVAGEQAVRGVRPPGSLCIVLTRTSRMMHGKKRPQDSSPEFRLVRLALFLHRGAEFVTLVTLEIDPQQEIM